MIPDKPGWYWAKARCGGSWRVVHFVSFGDGRPLHAAEFPATEAHYDLTNSYAAQDEFIPIREPGEWDDRRGDFLEDVSRVNNAFRRAIEGLGGLASKQPEKPPMEFSIQVSPAGISTRERPQGVVFIDNIGHLTRR